VRNVSGFKVFDRGEGFVGSTTKDASKAGKASMSAGLKMALASF